MSVSLSPMPVSTLGPWLDRTMHQYVESRIRAGDVPEAAAENARRSREASFPDGTPAEGHLVFDVLDDADPARPVGYLWIGPRQLGSDEWWVWDVEIDAAHRGRGLGRVTMLRAEEEAARHGARTLGLNVFGYNTVARGLYESLGYETTAVHMVKTVQP